MTRFEKWPTSVPTALIASCTEVSTVRFCLVVRFLAACFLAEALPCTLRFAEIVFDFARAVLLAAVFFLFATDADFDLAWLCVLGDFFFDGGAAWAADVRALRAFDVALRAFR